MAFVASPNPLSPGTVDRIHTLLNRAHHNRDTPLSPSHNPSTLECRKIIKDSSVPTHTRCHKPIITTKPLMTTTTMDNRHLSLACTGMAINKLIVPETLDMKDLTPSLATSPIFQHKATMLLQIQPCTVGIATTVIHNSTLTDTNPQENIRLIRQL